MERARQPHSYDSLNPPDGRSMRLFIAFSAAMFAATPALSAGNCSVITKARQQMINDWGACVDEAVDRFAPQAETAAAIADAALTTCDDFKFRIVNNWCPGNPEHGMQSALGIESNFRKDAIARTMGWRAANARHRQ